MTRAMRVRAIGVVAGAVLLWPLVHLALVARAQIDPWELFGWAMYSQPPARVQVRVDVERGGETKPLRAMAGLRDAQVGFAQSRSRLGTLASPDRFVGQVFASDATIDAVVIVMRRVRLDRVTARLVADDESLRFERAAP